MAVLAPNVVPNVPHTQGPPEPPPGGSLYPFYYYSFFYYSFFYYSFFYYSFFYYSFSLYKTLYFLGRNTRNDFRSLFLG